MQKGSKDRFSFLFIGESTRLPPMWPGRRPHIWLSLWSVLVLAPRGVSLGTPVFLSPQNQHFQITIQSGMHGLTSSGALSIPQKFRFEISEISRAQWNGTLRLHGTNPSHRAFGYCSCKQDTKEQYWEQQFCQMERDISVRPTEMTRPVKVDHLQS